VRRRLFTTAALVLLGACTLPIPAQDLLPPAAIGKFRLASGQYLDIGKPRRVGLADRIDSIAYRPGTHRITAVGHRIVNGREICTIHLIAGNSGQDDTLVSLSEDLPSLTDDPIALERGIAQDQDEAVKDALAADWDLSQPLYIPSGWSGDGRYFITAVTDLKDGSQKVVSIDALDDPATVRTLAIDGYQMVLRDWSPDRTQISFVTFPTITPEETQTITAAQIRDTPRMFAVYDPATGKLTQIEKKDCSLTGWFNARALLFRLNHPRDGKRYLAYQLNDGIETLLTDMDATALREEKALPSAACPRHPEITLAIVDRSIENAGSSQSLQSLWLTQTGGQNKPSTVGIAAASRPTDQAELQVDWASDGTQFTYTLGGVLYVVDVTQRQPTPAERLAAGEDLPCDEMRQIAVSNLKQIGLGLIQYSQDYDEHFPPADGVDDRILPYLKDRDIYTVGRYHWSYTPPANLAIASIESPAETELGHIELPCAHIILYADGHVHAADTTAAPGDAGKAAGE
jgi:hypothetical protein